MQRNPHKTSLNREDDEKDKNNTDFSTQINVINIPNG
jgi:hypothetical protein